MEVTGLITSTRTLHAIQLADVLCPAPNFIKTPLDPSTNYACYLFFHDVVEYRASNVFPLHSDTHPRFTDTHAAHVPYMLL